MTSNVQLRIRAFVERNPHYSASELISFVAVFTGLKAIDVAHWLLDQGLADKPALKSNIESIKRFYNYTG